MEKRNIEITLETAKEWYNSNLILRDIALQAFSEEELKYSFKNIKTFEDAVKVLEYDKVAINNTIRDINCYSKASTAMFKLNIVRKALNLGQDLRLTKNPEHSNLYYPYNPFVTENQTYYNIFNLDKADIIGKIKNEGILYNVLGNNVDVGSRTGLGNFRSNYNIGYARSDMGFFGCASKEIALHFSKYFGMLITEAKYGDLPDFQIVESKY